MGYVSGWQKDDIKAMVIGKWPGILQTLGFPRAALRNRHQAYPMCGGKDRFRFDNQEGRGTYICGQCGSGDGWALLMGYMGWDFAKAAREVRKVVGTVRESAFPQGKSDLEADYQARVALWQSGRAIQPGDVADKYLHSRGIGELVYPKALRFSDSVYHPETRSNHPCLLAGAQGLDGKLASVQRIFLADDGSGQADVNLTKMQTKGDIPAGSAVRLGKPGEVLGIAEGVETALSASALYDIPVWSALTSVLLQQWEPPKGVEEVAIFGDNDPGFAGQAAAYTLAKKLVAKKFQVTVHIPPVPGQDFNDIHRAGGA